MADKRTCSGCGTESPQGAPAGLRETSRLKAVLVIGLGLSMCSLLFGQPGTEQAIYPRAVQNVFEAQLVLARQGISSGSIDGVIGPQTRAAIRAFQLKTNLAPTGELDAATKERLVLTAAPVSTYTITTNDLGRLQPVSATWLGKSQQAALDYETILELVAEKGHA